jgi:hypothetical protein
VLQDTKNSSNTAVYKEKGHHLTESLAVAEAGLELDMSLLEDAVHNLDVVHTDRFAAGHIRVGHWHMVGVDKVQHLPPARSTTYQGDVSFQEPKVVTRPMLLDGLLMKLRGRLCEQKEFQYGGWKISWVRVQIRNGARARWANVSTAMACRCCLGAKETTLHWSWEGARRELRLM